MPQATEPVLPLSGIRVLELTEGIAGPYATSLLGDLGADVLKVERPEGDWGRTSGAILAEDFGSVYIAMNRNKRTLGLNLRSAEGLAVVQRLVSVSDVVISNYRPGAMERLGLGADACESLRPGIVYCTISAFDSQGPSAARRGNDTGLQAVSGLMGLIGEPQGEPLRVAVPIIDFTAALFASQAVLAALLQPASSRRVDVSLINVAAALQTVPMTEWLNTGTTPRRHGNQNPFLSPAGTFRTADDRFVAVSCLRHSHWVALCEVLGLADLIEHPDFVDNAARVLHRSKLNAAIEPAFAAHDLATWLDRLAAADVLHAPVNDYVDLFTDPAIGTTVPVSSGEVGDGSAVRWIGNPVRFDVDFPAVRVPPSGRGEHSVEILREHGFTDEHVRALTDSGVVDAGPAARRAHPSSSPLPPTAAPGARRTEGSTPS